MSVSNNSGSQTKNRSFGDEQIIDEQQAAIRHLSLEVERLKHELGVVVSTRHKEAAASTIAKQRIHFQRGMQRYAKGVRKYREQHLLDKDYIQRQKRELRRLNALVPPIERALVSKVKVEDACPLCGCLWPATSHEALAHNLKAIVSQRDTAVVKLKGVTGELRRFKAGVS